jgi:ribosome modulation factor
MRYWIFAILLLVGCGGANVNYEGEGHEAAMAGLPPEACPYGSNTSGHFRWKRGWADGFKAKNAMNTTTKATQK